MNNTNYGDFLWAIKDMLQDKVADYLDVNRQHIDIVFLGTDIIGEDCIDWDADEDDAAEGFDNETYYSFSYSYRKDIKTTDYEEPVDMVWQHTESEEYGTVCDRVMTFDEFDKLFEDKKHNVCSMLWYEKPKPIVMGVGISGNNVKS